MKSLLLALSMCAMALSLSLASVDAQAKRLGGGRPAGMQRQATPPPPAKPADGKPAATPTQQAAPAAAAAPPPAAPKRSWMGPLAGLAAGLGLAALFSHFGMGEGLSNMVMMVLLAVVAVVAIRFFVSRFAGRSAPPLGGLQPAGAGAAGAMGGWSAAPGQGAEPLLRQASVEAPLATGGSASPVSDPSWGSAFGAAPTVNPTAGSAAGTPIALPGGMAHEDFLRLAKMVFIRLQAANDAGNVDDLRKFTTPELFASLRLDLQERGSAPQQTDVVQLDAEVVDVAREAGQDVVSVRFHGLVREQAEAGAGPIDEVWHLVRPADGGANWAIAGITPAA